MRTRKINLILTTLNGRILETSVHKYISLAYFAQKAKAVASSRAKSNTVLQAARLMGFRHCTLVRKAKQLKSLRFLKARDLLEFMTIWHINKCNGQCRTAAC